MSTTITTRVALEDKKNFEAFCESVGITPSTAINIFVKCTLKEGKIPFEISADPFYSAANQARLEKNAAIMERGGGKIHEVKLDD